MSQTRNGRPVTSEAARKGSVAGPHSVPRPADRTPKRARSVWSQLELWRRATSEQRQLVAAVVDEARQQAARRRARVLAHPDIAAQLTRLGHERPDNWSDYVPPKIAYYADGTSPANDSPVRRELVAILNAVAEREGVR